MRLRHKGIIICLLAALFIRIILVYVAIGWREHPDILRYKDWAQIATIHGLSDTYTDKYLTFGSYPNNQPPGSLYILTLSYRAWLFFGNFLSKFFYIAPGSNAWVNVVLLTIFLRLPSLFADLGIGFMLYHFFGKVKKIYNKRVAPYSGILAASCFLFNPAVLFNSSIWGQMDAINNFFFVLSLWFVFQKKMYLSVISFTISLLMKFSLIYMIPLMVVSWWIVSKRISTMMAALFVMISILYIFVLPISHNPFQWLFTFVVQNARGEMTNISAFAFNFWWVLFHPTVLMGPSSDITKVVDISLQNSPLTQTMYGSISLGTIAVVVSVAFQLLIYWWCIGRLKYSIKFSVIMLTAVSCLSIIAFLSLPQMHERYLYPLWAPLALLIGFRFPVFWEFVLLSLFNMINLVVIWHPMPLPPLWFDVWRDSTFQWVTAICTVVICVWTIYKMLMHTKTYTDTTLQ